MKTLKKRTMLIIVIFIGLTLLGLGVFFNEPKDVSSRLTKTRAVAVTKLSSIDNFEEKIITNSSEINEIIKIIQNRKPMSEEENIPYRQLPHYRLKMLDKRKSIIIEINFFYYNKDTNWILFSNDDTYYTIDANLLLKIIDF